MLRDVRHEVQDGLLGGSGDGGVGIHVKIGASPMENETPIIILGSMSATKIKDRLGDCPLADKVMDSVENGSSRIICIPVNASKDGTIGTVSSAVTGTGSCSLTGSPTNAFDIVIKILSEGTLNVATFSYSINGGYTFSDEYTVSTTGQFELVDTGVKVTFTATEDQTFKVGDTFSWSTTAPQMTNADVIHAIDKLRYMNEEFGIVHIVGESTKDLWVSVSEKQKELEEIYHKPEMFVMEAYNIEADEEVVDYALRLENDRKSINNYAIQVVAARSLYKGMDGITREINNAGIVTGLYSKAKINQSIGETATFSISEEKMLELRPSGIEECLDLLDKAKYLTFRQYDGLSGYYVTNARMMCGDNSDFKYAEDVRVLHKIIRVTRKAALLLLQQDVDTEDVDGDFAAKAEFISAPVEDMIDAKEISSVSITIPSGQDILATETMTIMIRYVPRGKIREIVIDLGVRNPNA